MTRNVYRYLATFVTCSFCVSGCATQLSGAVTTESARGELAAPVDSTEYPFQRDYIQASQSCTDAIVERQHEHDQIVRRARRVRLSLGIVSTALAGTTTVYTISRREEDPHPARTKGVISAMGTAVTLTAVSGYAPQIDSQASEISSSISDLGSTLARLDIAYESATNAIRVMDRSMAVAGCVRDESPSTCTLRQSTAFAAMVPPVVMTPAMTAAIEEYHQSVVRADDAISAFRSAMHSANRACVSGSFTEVTRN